MFSHRHFSNQNLKNTIINQNIVVIYLQYSRLPNRQGVPNNIWGSQIGDLMRKKINLYYRGSNYFQKVNKTSPRLFGSREYQLEYVKQNKI